MKTNQMRTGKGYLCGAFYSKSQPPLLRFGRNSKAGRGVGKLYNEKKGKASRMSRLEAVGLGKLQVG